MGGNAFYNTAPAGSQMNKCHRQNKTGLTIIGSALFYYQAMIPG